MGFGDSGLRGRLRVSTVRGSSPTTSFFGSFHRQHTKAKFHSDWVCQEDGEEGARSVSHWLLPRGRRDGPRALEG